MLDHNHPEDSLADDSRAAEIEEPIDTAIAELEKSIPQHSDEYWNGYRKGMKSLKKAIVRVLMSQD